jgi:hypothetical protein
MRQTRDNSISGNTHASRVGYGASPQRFFSYFRFRRQFVAAEKFAMARAPSPAREARALPETLINNAT